ncbi:LOW QUALITY PROTEIN: hypothetical protein TorRG33x02_284680 [Trema orientale]|uniref:Uncharacterized protein n=1 Tax=Trema orientale TaxID=63057 RepID=A0A2P5CHJ6_TREOI|nr:LOW QUALITY PROTEIN: hypothetical protein TorRG33x02_284680 [Trema orientale]
MDGIQTNKSLQCSLTQEEPPEKGHFSLPNFVDRDKTSHEELVNQFAALTIDDTEPRNMPVLVTDTMSVEEQLQEIRKMLAEKEEEVARLSVELAKQASDCYVLKNIIEGMIKRKEIEVDSSLSKAASNNISSIESSQSPKIHSSKDAIPVAFEVHKEVNITKPCPESLKLGNSNIPTLYELLAEPNLEINEPSDGEDDPGNTWHICTRKGDKNTPNFPLTRKRTPIYHGIKFRGREEAKKNKKKKKKAKKKTQILDDDEYEQPERTPVTLKEFLLEELRKGERTENDEIVHCYMTTTEEETKEPTSYESKELMEPKEVDQITLQDMRRNIIAQKAKEAKELEKAKRTTNSEKPSISTHKEAENGPIEIPVHHKSRRSNEYGLTQVNYDILAHLKHIPALLSVYDALQMSPELRNALVVALTSPEFFKEKIESIGEKQKSYSASCLACITFDDEDHQLGAAWHNRPLYVTGLVADTRVSRIMLDCGSAVKVLPLKTLRNVGLHPR